RIAARTIAQLPKATFVTRLRSSQSPGQTARQLPDPSTLIRVESSSTRETRLQGAHREHKLRPKPARQSPTLLTSGDGKRSDWPSLKPPRPSSTLQSQVSQTRSADRLGVTKFFDSCIVASCWAGRRVTT